MCFVVFCKPFIDLILSFCVSGVLFFVSATINPILYNLMSKKYRQAFKDTLCWRCSPSDESRRLRDDRGRIFSEKYSNSTLSAYGYQKTDCRGDGKLHRNHRDTSPMRPNHGNCTGHYSNSKSSSNSSPTMRDTSLGTRIKNCINGSAPYSKGRQSSDCIEMSNQGKPNVP